MSTRLIHMLMDEECVNCLRRSFIGKENNSVFIEEVEQLLSNRKEASAPEIVYYFNKIREKYYGKKEDQEFVYIKSQFNQLVLSLEADILKKINESSDPLFESLLLARVGNYIDFSAIENVDPDTFISMLFHFERSELDRITYNSFVEKCEEAKSLLLLADNCGEIVLDKIFVQELQKRFPKLEVTVMVRGGLCSNDATMEDALEIGLDCICRVITNGMAVAGTVYSLLGEEERKIMDEADVIVSKGQANYESMHGNGIEVYYSFLCKCDMFWKRFNVAPLTGMFVVQR